MGTELGLLKLPCLVDVFFLWLQGTPLVEMIGRVPAFSHLMPLAIAVPGWSHTWAGLMSKFCKRWGKWPEALASLRCVCTWLRNDTHREHVLRKLPRDIVDNRVRKQYRSFKPSFAKWRYETIHDVFLELLIRLPTLLLIQAAWFPNPQDKEELKNFLAAIAWKELWVFVRVAFEFGIKKMEKCRRWGLVCACCAHLYAEGKRPLCERSGRRLHQARKRVQSLTDDIRESIRTLRIADCGDSLEMMRWVALTLRCAISDIVEKFNFLSVLPWRFAESGEPDQSLECIYLYRSSSGHDHVTLAIFGRLVSDIEARSRGEPMTEQHSTELGCFLNASLDESPGEGWHRTSNMTKKRGAHTRLVWIMGTSPNTILQISPQRDMINLVNSCLDVFLFFKPIDFGQTGAASRFLGGGRGEGGGGMVEALRRCTGNIFVF